MKNRIPKERIIYSSYEILPKEEIKEIILENNPELMEDDITDNMLYEEQRLQDEFNWEIAEEELKRFFSNGHYILVGTIGRWDGCYDGGFLFDSFDEMLRRATKDCDYIKLYDENGHFYLSCTHHDGSCHYEIKEITDAGFQYYENWSYGNDRRTERYIHTQIMNKYSRLPRFCEKVYGCKKVEYEPITKQGILNNQAKSFY